MQTKPAHIEILQLLLCIVVFSIYSSSTNAQQKDESFRRFRLDISVGNTHPLLNSIQKGHVFSIEPKYLINNRWQIGCRWEHAHIGPYQGFSYLSSIAVTADWFVSTNQLRPFFGVGLGSYKTSDIKEGPSTWHWYTPAGVLYRTGVEWWHLKASIEANILNKQSGFVFDYLGLKAGGHIEFGKKKRIT